MVYPADVFSVRQQFAEAQALYHAGQRDGAAATLQQLLTHDPDNFSALHFMGRLALEAGEAKIAARYLTRAVDLSPENPAVLNDCAVALASAGDIGQTADMFSRLLQVQPDNPDNYRNYGLFLTTNGRSDEAIPILKKYTSMAPADAKGHMLLNSAYSRAGRLEEGVQECERAVTADPKDLGAQLMKGQMLLLLGRPAEALPALVAAEQLAPKSASAIGHKGMALIALGHFTEGRAALKQALLLEPQFMVFLHGLMDLGTLHPGDDRLPFLQRAAAGIRQLNREEQIDLHMTLGKVESDFGHAKAAMAHWRAANTALHQDVAYDEAAELGQLATLARVFTPAFLAAHRGHGIVSDLPVLIVGMPRSGTTLLEQILASHSGVFGVGECPYWNQLVLDKGLGEAFPCHISDVSPDIWHKVGKAYLQQVQAYAPDGVRIVDKQPANFRWIGAIHLALPGAKFLYVRRDPADCALSCYSKNFQAGFHFIYNLAELGRYMRATEILMAHWKNVLPPDSLLEVQYEDLVQDFEPQVRRILSFMGLGWEENCVRFYETRRTVVTSSLYDARQPLSRKSIGRAKPYQAMMQAFFDAYNGVPEP